MCEYSPNSLAAASSVTAHSPLVGVALDGRGIYGAWESAGATPTLDACGGHVGTIPVTASATVKGVIGSASSGISGLAVASTYHYHLSTKFPYTIGCYSTALLSYTACTALYPGCKSYRPLVYANGSTYFYDDWCPCGTTTGTGLPVSSINAVPAVTGAVCYSSYAGISAPTSAASVGTTAACTTTQLSATISATGRRLLDASEVSAPTADSSSAAILAAQGSPCDGWCAPPGFSENFPHTVSRYLGLTAQQEGLVVIDRVFSVQNPGVFPASYSIVQVWYYLPSSNSTQSASFMKILNTLPSNPAFIADLNQIFPGVTSLSIGTSTPLLGSVTDDTAALAASSPSSSAIFGRVPTPLCWLAAASGVLLAL